MESHLSILYLKNNINLCMGSSLPAPCNIQVSMLNQESGIRNHLFEEIYNTCNLQKDTYRVICTGFYEAIFTYVAWRFPLRLPAAIMETTRKRVCLMMRHHAKHSISCIYKNYQSLVRDQLQHRPLWGSIRTMLILKVGFVIPVLIMIWNYIPSYQCWRPWFLFMFYLLGN